MEELAKVLVLGVIAAVLLAWIMRGSEGPKLWWAAKFLGHPSGGAVRG